MGLSKLCRIVGSSPHCTRKSSCLTADLYCCRAGPALWTSYISSSRCRGNEFYSKISIELNGEGKISSICLFNVNCHLSGSFAVDCLLPNRAEAAQNASAFFIVRASSRYAADFFFVLHLVCLGSVLLPSSIHYPKCEAKITSDTSIIYEGLLSQCVRSGCRHMDHYHGNLYRDNLFSELGYYATVFVVVQSWSKHDGGPWSICADHLAHNRLHSEIRG